jgi:hypothetical protein
VVSDNAVGSVDAVGVLYTKFSRVWAHTGQLLYACEDGSKDISVVVGPLVLNHGNQTFKAHAGIDMLCGEGLKRAVFFAVVLDENVVPDLEDVGVVLVDEMGGVAPTDTIEVNFAINLVRAGILPRRAPLYLQGPQGPVAPISEDALEHSTEHE